MTLADHLTEIETLARQLDRHIPPAIDEKSLQQRMLLESLKVGILNELRRFTQELTMYIEDDDV